MATKKKDELTPDQRPDVASMKAPGGVGGGADMDLLVNMPQAPAPAQGFGMLGASDSKPQFNSPAPAAQELVQQESKPPAQDEKVAPAQGFGMLGGTGQGNYMDFMPSANSLEGATVMAQAFNDASRPSFAPSNNAGEMLEAMKEKAMLKHQARVRQDSLGLLMEGLDPSSKTPMRELASRYRYADPEMMTKVFMKKYQMDAEMATAATAAVGKAQVNSDRLDRGYENLYPYGSEPIALSQEEAQVYGAFSSRHPIVMGSELNRRRQEMVQGPETAEFGLPQLQDKYDPTTPYLMVQPSEESPQEKAALELAKDQAGMAQQFAFEQSPDVRAAKLKNIEDETRARERVKKQFGTDLTPSERASLETYLQGGDWKRDPEGNPVIDRNGRAINERMKNVEDMVLSEFQASKQYKGLSPEKIQALPEYQSMVKERALAAAKQNESFIKNAERFISKQLELSVGFGSKMLSVEKLVTAGAPIFKEKEFQKNPGPYLARGVPMHPDEYLVTWGAPADVIWAQLYSLFLQQANDQGLPPAKIENMIAKEVADSLAHTNPTQGFQ